MSTPSSPSLHPTRRQLDELDALMERMLEVPVKTAEGEAAATSTGSSAESGSESSLLTDFNSTGFESYRTEEGESTLLDLPSAFDFSGSVKVQDSTASSTSETQGPSPFVFQSTPSSAIPASPSTSVQSSPVPVMDDPPAPIWMWPVLGINRSYDGLMNRLGMPGRILLGRGRSWLGWMGLVMVAAALVWGILDWIHWAG
jgi:hypothetical protein